MKNRAAKTLIALMGSVLIGVGEGSAAVGVGVFLVWAAITGAIIDEK